MANRTAKQTRAQHDSLRFVKNHSDTQLDNPDILIPKEASITTEKLQSSSQTHLRQILGNTAIKIHRGHCVPTAASAVDIIAHGSRFRLLLCKI